MCDTPSAKLNEFAARNKTAFAFQKQFSANCALQLDFRKKNKREVSRLKTWKLSLRTFFSSLNLFGSMFTFNLTPNQSDSIFNI